MKNIGLTHRPFTLLCLLSSSLLANTAPAANPNIIFILADDLGYGDVQALNSNGKIPTPNIDAMTKNGMTFTDAHTTSSVCTPTRYALLTGRYNWRTSLEKGVLWGYSQPLIVRDRITVGKLLQRQGYNTACIGKWHLGMDWTLKEGGLASKDEHAWLVDYEKTLGNTPITRGFDYFFGISASLDMFPFVYIENDRVQGVPTVEKHFYRTGPAHIDFEDIDVMPTFTRKATEYIDSHANRDKPFFLYFPLSAPHTPISPTKDWQGKSGLNSYADFVMQVDDTVGQVLAALKRNGIEDNTLVIFTSDNGCSPEANFRELGKLGHDPSYIFRGHKADIFEGGHRVPFIAQWPDVIKSGTKNDHPLSLVDFTATAADITNATLSPQAAVDSISFLPLLKGAKVESAREAIVTHSINGAFAITKGKWKLALCPGSGGWSDPRPGRTDLSNLPPVQLYDLEKDIRETNNLADQIPKLIKQLTALLQSYVDNGRSTPGSPQSNDRKIDIHKAGRIAHQQKSN